MIIWKHPMVLFMEGEGGGQGAGGSGGEGGTGDGGQGGEGAGGGQTFTIDQWRDALPEDLSTHQTLAKFNGKGFEEVVKSYINAEKLLGGSNRVAIPGENATDEDWGNFFNSLGRPENADGYELAGVEEPPEGYKYPTALEKTFKDWAHKRGLSAKQAKGLWKDIVGHTVTSFNENSGKIMQAQKQAWDDFNKEYGGTSKDRVALAEQTFKAVNSMLGKEHPLPDAFLKSAEFVRFLAVIGEKAGEDFLGSAGNSGNTGKTVNEMKSEIAEINAKMIKMDKRDPEYKILREKRENLYQMAYPDEQ